MIYLLIYQTVIHLFIIIVLLRVLHTLPKESNFFDAYIFLCWMSILVTTYGCISTIQFLISHI